MKLKKKEPYSHNSTVLQSLMLSIRNMANQLYSKGHTPFRIQFETPFLPSIKAITVTYQLVVKFKIFKYSKNIKISTLFEFYIT